MSFNDYDALKPYVDRLRQGEFDLLWPGYPLVAKSSGQPVIRASLSCEQGYVGRLPLQGGKDVLAIYTDNNIDSRSFGKGLTLSSHQIDIFTTPHTMATFGILIENIHGGRFH